MSVHGMPLKLVFSPEKTPLATVLMRIRLRRRTEISYIRCLLSMMRMLRPRNKNGSGGYESLEDKTNPIDRLIILTNSL